MKKLFVSIFLLQLLGSCSSDLELANDYLKKGIHYRSVMNIDSAVYCLKKSIELDSSVFESNYNLFELYCYTNSPRKALEVLDQTPIELRDSINYDSNKALMLESLGRFEEAKEFRMNYSHKITLNTPSESNQILSYTSQLIELAFANKQDLALDSMNNLLRYGWINHSDSVYVATIRNEIEFYGGFGYRDFSPRDSIIKSTKYCIQNKDSIIDILTRRHVNIDKTFSQGDNGQATITIRSKFNKALHDMGMQKCES
jgi:hypothetical protein